MAKSGSVSSSSCPMTLNGGNDDVKLQNSHVLTRKELLQRRLRRTRQLGRCYRAHYWALMEEIRSKYREYCKTYGRNAFEEDHMETDTDNPNNFVSDVNGDDIVQCHFSGCKTKAMALTKYCHTHILFDSKQKLYQRCHTIVKTLPTKPAICHKPVLRSVVPPTCPTHDQFGEKCLARALRKAGLRNTIPPNHKPTVKLHVIVSEFVNQIQNKRKHALKEIPPKVEAE